MLRRSIAIAYLFSLGILIAGLTGCAGGIGAGGAAIGAGLATIAPQLLQAQTVISEVAKAACASQSAANLGAELAQRQGSQAWAARLSEASKIAGLGCAW